MEARDAAEYIAQRRVDVDHRRQVADKILSMHVAGATEKLHGLIRSLMQNPINEDSIEFIDFKASH